MHSLRRSSLGAALAVGLAGVWIGCVAASGAGDPIDESPAPTSPTTQPTSSRPSFEASFPDDAGGEQPDGSPEGSTSCNDPNDVGGSEAVAQALANITDNDSNGSSVTGVVNGPVDVDFYKFEGTDTFIYVADPTLSSSSTGVELCIYVACSTGNISFKNCSGGAQQKTNSLGDPGCCFTAPGSTTLDYDCSTPSESAAVFIRVGQSGAACLPYTASYHF